jgi:hypothetical protein
MAGHRLRIDDGFPRPATMYERDQVEEGAERGHAGHVGLIDEVDGKE